VKLPPIEYASPRSVEEVIGLLSRHEDDAKILSGGQSLIPLLALRVAACRLLIDLKYVRGLDRIVIGSDGVELGARVRWYDIEQDQRLRSAHPLLAEAVPHIAHYQIRNRGTVGGSLAHADPAAELPALAVACEAQIVAAGPNGLRSIPANEFFLSPLVTALGPHEMIIAVRFPAWPSRRRYAFIEFARRRGDFALAGAVAFYDPDKRGRISNPHVGAFGVADTPVRLFAAEAALEGALPDERVFARAAKLGTTDLDARSDIHADHEYRRGLLTTLLIRALQKAARQTDT
jgi:aerobic carbon-monoxide dehydrogenase medium subunit